MEKFAEWQKATAEYVDDMVQSALEDLPGGEVEDDDALSAAATAIEDALEGLGKGSPLYEAVAKSLASEWLDYAYRNWYTGDIDQAENESRLLYWLDLG